MSELPPRDPQQKPNSGGYPPSQQYPPAQQYPPQPPAGGNYPPPQQYPPQQPSGGNYPPPQQYPPQQPYPPRSTGPLPPYAPPSNTRPLESKPPSPKLGEKSGNAFVDSFNERRIEYLAWGSVILLAGFGIILLAIDTEFTRDLLLIAGPLTVGAILLSSSFLQRIVFGFSVSLFTWGAAVLTSAFGLTQLIAALTDTRSSENTPNQILYFFGLLVIISGMVVILQVFRRPQE